MLKISAAHLLPVNYQWRARCNDDHVGNHRGLYCSPFWATLSTEFDVKIFTMRILRYRGDEKVIAGDDAICRGQWNGVCDDELPKHIEGAILTTQLIIGIMSTRNVSWNYSTGMRKSR